MSKDFVHRPFYSRCMNAAGRMVPAAQWLPFAGERLKRAAIQRSGCADFGPAEYEPGLARLMVATEEEAQLNLIGRVALRSYTRDLLVNRLLLERAASDNPAIRRRQIKAPLFILGLPRTGTTLLHNLLAQDSAIRVPWTWEVMFPVGHPAQQGQRERFRKCERALRWLDRLAPGFQRIHPVAAGLPQECIAITAHSFASIQFHTTQQVSSYQDWLEGSDQHFAYREHRSFLQHLQMDEVAPRWVLKAPAHIFSLEALFAEYEDARIVQMHRDPLRVVPSIASHGCVLRSAFSDRTDPRQIARDWSTRWASGLCRAMMFRAARPELQARFLDLHYDDLMHAPMQALDRVRAHAALPTSADAQTRSEHFLAANRQNRHGRHRYSLEQFALDRDEEQARFATYVQRYSVRTEGDRQNRA